MSIGTSDTDLRFSCRCGQITGHLSAAAVKSGTRLVCYCKDCRAGHIHLNQPDPAPGPIDIFQTNPEGVSFDTGKDQIGLFRFSPNGLMRWYATCCNTPLFNTLTTPKAPFVGVLSDIVEDTARLGAVQSRANIPQPGGKSKTENFAKVVLALVRRMAGSRLSGAWKRTPFFDVATGEPVVTPQVLTREQRAAANK